MGSNSYQFGERKKFHAWERYRASPPTELATDHCGGLRCDLPKEKENRANSSKIRWDKTPSAAAARLPAVKLRHRQASGLHGVMCCPPPGTLARQCRREEKRTFMKWLARKEQSQADPVQASLVGGSRLGTPETLLSSRGHDLSHFCPIDSNLPQQHPVVPFASTKWEQKGRKRAKQRIFPRPRQPEVLCADHNSVPFHVGLMSSAAQMLALA